MDRFTAQTFITRLLDNGYMRSHLEQALGYEEVARIRDAVIRGDYRTIGSLIEYIKSVCEELEGI